MILRGGRGSQPRIEVCELGQREAAVGCGVGHPVEVTVEGLEGEITGGSGDCSRRCMECTRVGRDQGTWSCGGGGDAVDQDGGGCADEDTPPLPCLLLFTLDRELMGEEGRLPCGPHIFGTGEAVLVGALIWEASFGEERAGGDS